MAKYHINPETGNANKCGATKDNCPFGGQADHYANAEEARAAYEALMDEADVALKSIHKEMGEKRAAKRDTINGLEIVNRTTGKVESFVPMNKSELDMPGYLESVEKGYDGTKWEARRSYEAQFEEDNIYGEYCHVCRRSTDHVGEHEALVDAGYAVYENGDVVRTPAYDEQYVAVLREVEYQAYDSRFSISDPEKDSDEVKALKEELAKLESSPGRTQHGFPEDEQTRYYVEQAINKKREEIKALDPNWDHKAEKRAVAAQESLAATIANARFLADPRNRKNPVPTIEVKEGSETWANVVVAHVQYNKVLPGTAPQDYTEAGTKQILVPNINRLTTNKKVAIADELYAASGRNLATWHEAGVEAKLRWLESRTGKYKDLTVTREGDKISWSNRYSSSHNADVSDVRVLDLS